MHRKTTTFNIDDIQHHRFQGTLETQMRSQTLADEFLILVRNHYIELRRYQPSLQDLP